MTDNPKPLATYAINLSMDKKLHPDGKIRHHIVLHYSTETANLAMDLGPHEAVALLVEQFVPALQSAVDRARQEDSGLTVANGIPEHPAFKKRLG